MDKKVYDNYVKLLHDELTMATGCTEPIAIAYAGAKLREVLGDIPEHCTVYCSGNIVKNVMAVTVPNSGGARGIDTAALLGIIGGDASRVLDVLHSVSDEDIALMHKMVVDHCCDCELVEGVANLYIRIEANKGDQTALTKDELEGYVLFRDSGCVACHNGVAVGGNSFQRMGLVEPYKTDNPAEGRVAVTGADADRFNFKVPTLRNVELTYPYFHDGAAGTLSEAVDTMGRIQLGKKFTPEENAKIVAFLKTLTGDQPQLTMPILPPSSDKTPRPEPFAKK